MKALITASFHPGGLARLRHHMEAVHEDWRANKHIYFDAQKFAARINAVGAEYSSIIKNAMRASSNFGLGNTAEILITTDKATMIMMMVGQNYFVTLAINLDGNLGRGRLELKKAIPKFEKELT